jgi:hypothetical protein
VNALKAVRANKIQQQYSRASDDYTLSQRKFTALTDSIKDRLESAKSMYDIQQGVQQAQM